MGIFVFNFTDGAVPLEDIIPAKEYTLIGPLSESFDRQPMIVIEQWGRQQLDGIGIPVDAEVVVLLDPTIRRIALSYMIVAAMAELGIRCAIWATGSTTGVYVDVSSFQLEGRDWAYQVQENQRKKLLAEYQLEEVNE